MPADFFDQVRFAKDVDAEGRHVNRPAETGGELYEVIEKLPPPEVDLELLYRIEKERGKRSGRRK